MPPSAVSPKIPHAMPPHSPHRPCSAHTPNTSSICHLLVEIWNICTKIAPATPPTMSAPMGCITSDPAHTATRPASAPLCTNPGSLSPTMSATTMPPHMAISELIATRPETASSRCALITLNPNQPMHRSQEPMASQGMDEGGGAVPRPS